jgi:uncharacterized protein YndB with AHSA1/START domain
MSCTSTAPGEYGEIVKEIHIAAAPAVVYQVISRPEHIRAWWAADADIEPVPGADGELVFRDRERGRTTVVRLTVLEAVPDERFAFRWDYPPGEAPTSHNSMLVTFRLAPEDDGTRLTVVEEGFRERGWEAAVLEDYYRRHDHGWTRHLADLVAYAARVPGPRA